MKTLIMILIILSLPLSTHAQNSKYGCKLYDGTVKWFQEQKGYGFIEKQDGGDLLVRHHAIQGEGRKILSEGERVQFCIGKGPKGPEATVVIKI